MEDEEALQELHRTLEKRGLNINNIYDLLLYYTLVTSRVENMLLEERYIHTSEALIPLSRRIRLQSVPFSPESKNVTTAK